MPKPDPHTSAVGRAILDGAVAGEPIQRQSGVWSKQRIAHQLVELSDRMDTIALQMGEHATEPEHEAGWQRHRNELAGAAIIARRWASEIQQEADTP
jgi:hypothetical protein